MGARSSREAQRQRQRRYRERRKAGRRVIMIEVDEVALGTALERLHFLNPLIADDDGAIKQALGEMIQELCRGLADDA